MCGEARETPDARKHLRQEDLLGQSAELVLGERTKDRVLGSKGLIC